MAGTENTSPGNKAATERLRNWAVTGPGRALFAWGTPGDFARCQSFYADKLPPQMIDGWCANLHHVATGGWPGHAPGAEQALADRKTKAAKAAKKAS